VSNYANKSMTEAELLIADLDPEGDNTAQLAKIVQSEVLTFSKVWTKHPSSSAAIAAIPKDCKES
jgi:hypothetical protein